MSTPPENELDLEQLLFLPAWAQKPSDARRYSDFRGEPDRPQRRGDDRSRGPRPQGNRPPPRGAGARPQKWEPRDRSDRPLREHDPLPELSVSFIPEEKGVDLAAKQIRVTGRAYPLFDIAQIILKKPERQQVRLEAVRKPGGEIAQPLFLCAIDDTLWLSEADAVNHVLTEHFATFYQSERIPADPPKGTYTFVAQCGMSGTILGPPNYHGYQNHLRKLHAERFSHMPFEGFKARVRIVKDEAVVKKWIDDQSWRTEYVCLNLPEPLRLSTREEVEKHFRETHQPNVIQPVDAYSLNGDAVRQIRDPRLQQLIRHHWDDQKRFPLRVVNVLSQQFASRGLQFFKVNRTITHVAAARPHFLDLENTPVSPGVKQIVDFINSHPGCNRRQLIDALAPGKPREEAAPAPETSGESAPPPEAAPEISPEQTAVIGDLHWLVHQGHVIEFASGRLETARRPVLQPPRPEPKKKPSTPPRETPAAESGVSQPEASAPATPVPAADVAAPPDDASDPEPAPVETPEAQGSDAPAPELGDVPKAD